MPATVRSEFALALNQVATERGIDPEIVLDTKKAIIADYSTKVGSIVNGMILRFDGPNIIVDIGRAEGVMPPQEQIPNEKYRLNQRLTFFIEGIKKTAR